MKRALSSLAVCVVAACGGQVEAPSDAGAGESDAGEHDAGQPDSGAPDAGMLDAGPSDAGSCPAKILIPSQGEHVGQAIQLSVSFPASCTGVDAMVAYIDGQRCDQSPYPSPNPGCAASTNQFSTSTWVVVTPGTHTLVVDSWQGSTVSVSAPSAFSYTPADGGGTRDGGAAPDAGADAGHGNGHDPVFAGAGDIGWYYGTSYEVGTGNELRTIDPDYVFTLGDNAYGANNNDQGALSNYDLCYDPAWGSFKAKTLPVPGNHDYGNWDSQTIGQQRVMSGYYAYFTGGDATSPASAITVGGATWDALHYGFDLVTASGKLWRYISLNSGDCFRAPYDVQNCSTASSEYAWFQNELATHLKTVSGGPYVGIIVGTHFDRWSSAGCGGGSGNVDGFVQLMYDYHVDLYLAGHVHNYERFCPIGKTPGATTQGNCSSITGPVCDPAGPVEINVGTGGADDGNTANPDAWAASMKRLSQTGVAKLTLHDASWDFEFLSTSNTVLDSATYPTH